MPRLMTRVCLALPRLYDPDPWHPHSVVLDYLGTSLLFPVTFILVIEGRSFWEPNSIKLRSLIDHTAREHHIAIHQTLLDQLLKFHQNSLTNNLLIFSDFLLQLYFSKPDLQVPVLSLKVSMHTEDAGVANDATKAGDPAARPQQLIGRAKKCLHRIGLRAGKKNGIGNGFA
ncbi:hypothetical protein Scep_001416 [Stephania cephalantha]|uniref:Uncharacterized protein n=1 Tax=Stephania cephalantha TaxID=152367 RepID=A0AAP0Q3R9_9MAGN